MSLIFKFYTLQDNGVLDEINNHHWVNKETEVVISSLETLLSEMGISDSQ